MKELIVAMLVVVCATISTCVSNKDNLTAAREANENALVIARETNNVIINTNMTNLLNTELFNRTRFVVQKRAELTGHLCALLDTGPFFRGDSWTDKHLILTTMSQWSENLRSKSFELMAYGTEEQVELAREVILYAGKVSNAILEPYRKFVGAVELEDKQKHYGDTINSILPFQEEMVNLSIRLVGSTRSDMKSFFDQLQPPKQQ